MATLAQLAQQYLNQSLPDISGIRSLPQASSITSPVVEEDTTPQGLTMEQLRLMYPRLFIQQNQMGGGENDNNTNTIDTTNNAGINSFSDLTGITGIGRIGNIASYALGGIPGIIGSNIIGAGITGIGNLLDPNRDIFGRLNNVGINAQVANMAQARGIQKRIDAGEFDGPSTAASKAAANRESRRGGQYDGDGPGESGGTSDGNSPGGGGGYCFDPNTLIQMSDGSKKKIKDIQLGDDTKGGEVTGVFQFKAADEIHDYKGVIVAGSHYVKEDGNFIMVKDSPIAVKIDKIPVVYSLDTSGRRIFINNIEFADYNGDGVAKNFLTNAGVNLTGFDKEVLRQVENRIL